ncbi:hypothetical protein NQ318_012565 [Aromia moschata]|uniref:Uncharacterized protein n=1 Tax=Aromia moschata TaxID=1265417 RepID=A0AAV8YLB1_9CUCU|nr:hypothetical protein NQ318_012565 [Aromia moschata]
MEEVKQKVFDAINGYIQQHHALKINFELFGLYIIPEKELSDIKSFNTRNKIVTISTDLHEMYDLFEEEMVSKAAEFQERDSGWSLQQVMFLEVNINKYNPLAASSYIKLPKQIEVKKAVLNIQNNDTACFAWSITAAIFPANGEVTRTSSYPHYNTLLSFDEIDFPVKLTDIPRFEKLNNISVNVFGLESVFKDGKMVMEVVGPLYFTSFRHPTHVNLLLITDDGGTNHYCLINNLSRLVSRQKSKHKCKANICDGCLQFFPTCEKLNVHQENDCNHLCTVLPTTNLVINKYDTDSLILEIFTDNAYNDIKENIEHFDTSNYSIDNIHNIPKTISVVGKMKDEYSGTPIESFYGTGAKAYCVKAGGVTKKAKGISKNVIKNQLHLSDYIQIVENGGYIFRKMYVFTSNLHTIYTELKNKVALSSADNKRFLIPGSENTLAWGHFGITPVNSTDEDLDILVKIAQNLLDNDAPDFDLNL